MDKTLVKKSQEILARNKELPTKQRLERLIASGVIDEQGKVPLWSAFLAVIAVKRSNDGKRIEYFRCLQPMLGMPGAAEVDIRRDSMLQYVGKETKRVITAYRDERRNLWREGAEVRQTSKGYLRTDANDLKEDNFGDLPTFSMLNSRL